MSAPRLPVEQELLSVFSSSPMVRAVDRLSLDITVDGVTEVVVIAKDASGARCSCTAENAEAYFAEALHLLSGTPSTSGSEAPSPRSSLPPEAPGKKTATTVSPKEAARHRVAARLSDLVTAVARVGVGEASGAPAVDDALRQVTTGFEEMPIGLSRWVGMLKGSLGSKDLEHVARLLDGAGRAAEALLGGDDKDNLVRLTAWFGSDTFFDDGHGRVRITAPERSRRRISDLTLLEIGREQVAGVTLRSIERRYLLCLETHELFREERAISRSSTAKMAMAGSGTSVGPCPRVISVGLAEVGRGIDPKPIRLLQYAVGSEVHADQWDLLLAGAARTFEPVAASYKDLRTRFPAISEPVSLLAPDDLEIDGPLCLLDASDVPLPISKAGPPSSPTHSTIKNTIRQFTGDRRPDWIAGRLIDAGGTLMLAPFSLGCLSGREMRMLRLV